MTSVSAMAEVKLDQESAPASMELAVPVPQPGAPVSAPSAASASSMDTSDDQHSAVNCDWLVKLSSEHNRSLMHIAALASTLEALGDHHSHSLLLIAFPPPPPRASASAPIPAAAAVV